MHFLLNSPLCLAILSGASSPRFITHSSCGECVCSIATRPLAAAAHHQLPWQHLVTGGSDSSSWLGVVEPVMWNGWESVALTWSFCQRYLRNHDLPISWETLGESSVFLSNVWVYLPASTITLMPSMDVIRQRINYHWILWFRSVSELKRKLKIKM